MPHLIDINNLSFHNAWNIVQDAINRKKKRKTILFNGTPDDFGPWCKGAVMGGIFENKSTRTRLSCEIAMRQLKGSFIFMAQDSIQLSRGESIQDTARVLSTYLDILTYRTKVHSRIEELAYYSSKPVINSLTDKSHPCQVLADIMTYIEIFNDIRGHSLCWYGDGRSNVLNSYIEASKVFSFKLHIVTHHSCVPLDIQDYPSVEVHLLPEKNFLKECTAIITDTWHSMHEDSSDLRKKMEDLSSYRVTQEILDQAHKDCIFFHCMPLYRGEEVDSIVCDSDRSYIFQEAENKIHVLKSIILWCLS